MSRSADRFVEGVLLVDKPAGLSSHAVVARVRSALGLRKVGHAGTLDPDATGLLVIGIGRATRLLGYLTRSDKAYAATIRLGTTTDTDDAAGQVLSRSSCEHLSDNAIRQALARQVGPIDQVPSAVSAVKVDGRRAYARVRAGEAVDLPPRRVTIHSLEITGMRRTGGDGQEQVDIDIEVRCSAGTYIRAIARDAGASLGVGGHVVTLRRLASGDFDVAEAQPMEAIVEAGSAAADWMLPLRDAAVRSLPWLTIDAAAAAATRHGRVIPWPALSESDVSPPPSTGPTALVDDASLVAIAECTSGRTRYLAVFD